jgi:hypothetical protein
MQDAEAPFSRPHPDRDSPTSREPGTMGPGEEALQEQVRGRGPQGQSLGRWAGEQEPPELSTGRPAPDSPKPPRGGPGDATGAPRGQPAEHQVSKESACSSSQTSEPGSKRGAGRDGGGEQRPRVFLP